MNRLTVGAIKKIGDMMCVFKIENARTETDIQIGFLEWMEMAVPACEAKKTNGIFHANFFIFSAQSKR
jgi:hypothetical protein